MTDSKTKFEIEPEAEPADPGFDFDYILEHWLVLDNMPLGLIALGDIGIRPQAIYSLEWIELEEPIGVNDANGEPVMAPTGEKGIRAQSVAGGEVELDSIQSACLERIIKLVAEQAAKAGHPTSSVELIELIGKPPKAPSVIAPPWAKR